MSGLPNGWVEATLGDLFDVTSSKRVHQHEWAEEGVPFYRAREIKKLARVGFVHNELFIPEDLFEKYASEFGAPISGDLMVTAVGTLGECYRVREGDRFYFKDASVLWLRKQTNVESEYIARLFLSKDIQDQVHEGGGTTVGTYTVGAAKKTIVPLPPLAEQKRMVAKLDVLNAKSARAHTELARIETLVSRYKQAMLSKAFSGELTSGVDQGFEIARIDANPQVTPLWSVPSTWAWCRTDQVGRVGLGRQRSPKNHDGPQMRPYLRSANITWQGVDTSDVKEMNFDDAEFKRFKLEVGDVLLNEGSGSAKEVGKPAIWRGEIADCCYQNTLLRVQPHQCSSEYLYYYFLLTARAGRFVSSTQGVNIQHIGREGLACYPLPLAPEAEQHEIVRRIESAFAKIDRLAAEAKRALELVGKLDEAILAKAFRGELVSQDENEEPAHLLLERIRAERAVAQKAKHGRGKR